MADEKKSDSRTEGNIFELFQNERNFVHGADESNPPQASDETEESKVHAKATKEHRNLPGLPCQLQPLKVELEQSDLVAGIDNVVNNRNQTSPPEPKRPRLVMPANSPQSFNNNDASQSPESGKRRRVQHDYRRLSSAGYVDDYEKSKDKRFSLSSDSDTSPVMVKPKSNNTSPKTKSPNPFVALRLPPFERQLAAGGGGKHNHCIMPIEQELHYLVQNLKGPGAEC
jgi:hypothetical protein